MSLENTISSQVEDHASTAVSETHIQDVAQTLNAETLLTEDQILARLKQPDLKPEILEQFSKNVSALKNRKVKLALLAHPKTPRHVSAPMVRHLFTFDLMQLALMPVVPADIKKAADDALLNRLEKVSSGERLTLARRGSNRIAGELLLDSEARVMQAALENARLTETPIIKALTRQNASAAFVQAVCHHAKWSLRRDIRMALLCNDKAPLARALEFARSFPPAMVRELLQNSRLPGSVKSGILRELESR